MKLLRAQDSTTLSSSDFFFCLWSQTRPALIYTNPDWDSLHNMQSHFSWQSGFLYFFYFIFPLLDEHVRQTRAETHNQRNPAQLHHVSLRWDKIKKRADGAGAAVYINVETVNWLAWDELLLIYSLCREACKQRFGASRWKIQRARRQAVQWLRNLMYALDC